MYDYHPLDTVDFAVSVAIVVTQFDRRQPEHGRMLGSNNVDMGPLS